MWETIARSKDPFICQNLIAPILEELNATGVFDFKSIDEVHQYIMDHILDKQNEVINAVSNLYFTHLCIVN